MNRCPKCQEELVADSVICPSCGHVLDENNAFADMDSELEKFSQMIFNLENDIPDDFATPAYNPEDIEKILNGEISEEPIEEVVPESVVEEPVSEEVDDEEEAEVKTFTFTPSSFSASSDDDKEEEKTSEAFDNEFGLPEVYADDFVEDTDTSASEETTVINENIGVYTVDKSEAELDKVFAEMSQYTDVVVDENDDFISKINTKATDFSQNEILKQVNELRDEVLNDEEDIDIDAEIDMFIDEIDSVEIDPEKSAIKSDTYLQLNFVTTDKFATLISSENERSDSSENLGDDENSGKITDIFGLNAIVAAEKLSDQELASTIEAVNIQKDEIIHSLEQEEKDIQYHKYLQLRDKMVNVVKIGGVVALIAIILYLFCYIFDIGLFQIENKLYTEASIENYDNAIYSAVVDMEEIVNEVSNKLAEYESGNLTKEEMLAYCEESQNKLNKYKVVFDKDVYDEAEQYVFEATNAFFFAEYYVENIAEYVNTGDEYYLELNKIADVQVDNIMKEIEEARRQFLLRFGYTEDEISILDYKAGDKQ